MGYVSTRTHFPNYPTVDSLLSVVSKVPLPYALINVRCTLSLRLGSNKHKRRKGDNRLPRPVLLFIVV